jgi:hypothetical protein
MGTGRADRGRDDGRGGQLESLNKYTVKECNRLAKRLKMEKPGRISRLLPLRIQVSLNINVEREFSLPLGFDRW